MRKTIVEDRVLARIALEAVGWNGSATSDALADAARGQAIVALRVLGIPATPQVSRAVEDDIADIIADPDKLARAQAAPPRPACRMAA